MIDAFTSARNNQTSAEAEWMIQRLVGNYGHFRGKLTVSNTIWKEENDLMRNNKILKCKKKVKWYDVCSHLLRHAMEKFGPPH